MNTNHRAIMYLILAIDLGKYKSVAGVSRSAKNPRQQEQEEGAG